METIEFKLSRKKFGLAIIISTLFVIACLLFIVYPQIFKSFLVNNIFLIRTIGIIGFLLFGFILTSMLFKKISDKNIGFAISEKGIFDNSSYVGVGLIKWEDIKGIRRKTVSSTIFLLIDIKNPEEYIEHSKSKIKRRLLIMNYRSYGTPISISSNFIDCDFNVLEEAITNSLSKYRETII